MLILQYDRYAFEWHHSAPHASTASNVCLWRKAVVLRKADDTRCARRRSVIVVRQRMLSAVPIAGRAQLAIAVLFEPQRVRLRTDAASPYRPGWCPSPGETAQTAWRLRSGWQRTL